VTAHTEPSIGVAVLSTHAVGFVASPGRPQDPPPGHCELTVHGAPALLPSWHRRPPQIPGLPPLGGQSALSEQARVGTLLHVSH
jgi:hypothetical protein